MNAVNSGEACDGYPEPSRSGDAVEGATTRNRDSRSQ